MENKWNVVIMVFVLVVMAAIGGEAADLSCEEKCAITCQNSMFPKTCSTRCLESCRHPPPAQQLHTRVMVASGGEAASVGCVLKCELKCHDPICTSACFKKCFREHCQLPTSSTYKMKTGELKDMRG